jgi:anti-sigma regulatory factor (Ser/Thr protein kinase)
MPTTELLIHNPPVATIGADSTSDTHNPDVGDTLRTAPALASLTLPGRADQVRLARKWLADLVAGLPAADDIILVASELTANAVSHSDSGRSGGTLTVRVAVGADLVRVEVADAGGCWGVRPGRADRRHDELDDEYGRGLAIVECLATDWGIYGDDSGRTAWCELPACASAVREA